MFVPINDQEFCFLPLFFRPTTVMLVDDDAAFLKEMAYQLSEQYPVVTFTDPDEAIRYFEKNNADLFKKLQATESSNLLIQNTRKEIYNNRRFGDILVSVIDYEMPNKNGYDIISNMGLPILDKMSQHSYVLLTGKRFSDFEEELAKLSVGKNFISKWDPNRVSQLLTSIAAQSAWAFQWMSYPLIRRLSREPAEKNTFLFDGNFLPILNRYIQEQHVCELYLFDQQGSYLFLDENANLSWLFVRNDIGMVNSIQMAKKYHAPARVIDAIQSKEKLLSLYEKEDFEHLKTIDWDNYLLPATVFKSDDRYMKAFKLESNPSYYYALTKEFPAYPIDKKKILSYRGYLNTLD
jgi:CheY-like chemotaxis protein